MMHKRYTKEQCTAAEAQRLAQEIAFGPVVFQVSRLMLKFGIFQLLSGKREGYTLQEISGQTGLTRYAAQVLLEASLTIGTSVQRRLPVCSPSRCWRFMPMM